ncbi:MAG: hypothetical protein NPIRA03_36630 [Nitrospirales bacterium]|nr:MAG: hypothetical protein NPIRA03_36630 [Nitrospirales bacterium]
MIPSNLEAATQTMTVEGSVTYGEGFPHDPEREPIRVNKFDPNLGILKKVTCTAAVNFSGSQELLNHTWGGDAVGFYSIWVSELSIRGCKTLFASKTYDVFLPGKEFNGPPTKITQDFSITLAETQHTVELSSQSLIADIPGEKWEATVYGSPGGGISHAAGTPGRIFSGNFISYIFHVTVSLTYEYEPKRGLTLTPPLSFIGSTEHPIAIGATANKTLVVKNEAPGAGGDTCSSEEKTAFVIRPPVRTDELMGLEEQGPDPLPFSIVDQQLQTLCPQQSKEFPVTFTPQAPGIYDAKINIVVSDFENPVASAIVRGIAIKPEEPENWDVKWSVFPKPPEVFQQIPYRLQWTVANKAAEPKNFNYNVLIDKEYFRPDTALDRALGLRGEAIDPDAWEFAEKDVFTPCFFDASGQEQLVPSVQPGNPLTLHCNVIHSWNWIPPRDSLLGQVAGLAAGLFPPGGAFEKFEHALESGVNFSIALFDALNQFEQAAPRLEITYTPTDDAEGVPPQTITVTVPNEQIDTYLRSNTKYAEVAFLGFLGGMACLAPPPFNPVCLGLTGTALSYAIMGNVLFDTALDPRHHSTADFRAHANSSTANALPAHANETPSENYTVLAQPGPLLAIPTQGIEDPLVKKFVELSKEMPGIAEAAALSHERYLAALEAQSSEWAAIQQKARLSYNQMLFDREKQLGPLYEHLLALLPSLDEKRITQVRDFFQTHGIPEEIRVLYENQGFTEQDIQDLEESLAEADQVLYENVPELPTLNKINQKMHELEMARQRVPIEGIVPASVSWEPNAFVLGDTVSSVVAVIELDNGVDPAHILTDTLRLNGSPLPNHNGGDIGDHNRNGVADLTLKFIPEHFTPLTSEAGTHAFALTGELQDGTLLGGVGLLQVVPAGVDVVPGDFNGDGKGDIIWRNLDSTGVAVWLMNGMTIASPGFLGGVPAEWQIRGIGDIDGNGKADVVWKHSSQHVVAIWTMNGLTIDGVGFPGGVSSGWEIKGVGDMNGDGKADLLWQNLNSGVVAAWLMNSSANISPGFLGGVPATWQIQGLGDVNGDGKADVIWQNQNTGTVAIWMMNGLSLMSAGFPASTSLEWKIEGVGDVNGDGNADLVWKNATSNKIAIWLMKGTSIASSDILGGLSSEWKIKQIGDLNGDGKADGVFKNNITGEVIVWLLDGLSIIQSGSPGRVSPDWVIQP